MEELNKITDKIMACAIEGHRNLGPGLLESVYQQCLAYELSQADIPVMMEQAIPVVYKGKIFDCGFRADMIKVNIIKQNYRDLRYRFFYLNIFSLCPLCSAMIKVKQKLLPSILFICF